MKSSTPNINTTDANGTRISKIRNDLNQLRRDPIFSFEEISGKTFTLSGIKHGTNTYQFMIPFNIDGAPYSPLITRSTDWNMDLDTSIIDLTTDTGGLVDGITIEGERKYLVWGFIDENYEWAGIGATRKPYSAFTSSAGYAPGATGTYTVTNGFQFTIGARVVVRNNNGNAPQYRWNWGTVLTVADTTITVAMDNNSDYGNTISITAANGVIEQWDNFNPYVVTSTGQTLYTPYYSLLGEVFTVASEDILNIYMVYDPIRPVSSTVVDSNASGSPVPTIDTYVSCGRDIPLWANNTRLFLRIRATLANKSLRAEIGISVVRVRTQVGNGTHDEFGSLELQKNAVFYYSGTDATINDAFIACENYYVPGGMRK